MVQWLESICQDRGHELSPWSRESHMLPGNEAYAPQLLSPQALERTLPSKRRLHTATRGEPLLTAAREPLQQ